MCSLRDFLKFYLYAFIIYTYISSNFIVTYIFTDHRRICDGNSLKRWKEIQVWKTKYDCHYNRFAVTRVALLDHRYLSYDIFYIPTRYSLCSL